MTKQFFIRDAIFLLVTAIYVLMIVFIVRKYTMVLAVGHLILYLLFVIAVVVQSAMQAKEVKEDLAAEDGLHSRTISAAKETLRAADLVKMVEDRREGIPSNFTRKLPPAEILNEEDLNLKSNKK